jgi:DNA-3-methyladenine glycosylase
MCFLWYSFDMRKKLRKDFFEQPTLFIAEKLLGKSLVRNGKRFMITETEAYDGFEDKASHASRGETSRNRVMFGEAGVWYVYFVYGIHSMLNIVTGTKGYPAAVLIRGIENISGPARLTKALGVDRSMNEQKAIPESGLWIEDNGIFVPKNKIKKTPRIGIVFAGEEWSKKPWRFVLNMEK